MNAAPNAFDGAGLYLSFLIAVSLLAALVFALLMALQPHSHKSVVAPQVLPIVTPVAVATPQMPQPLSSGIAETLRQTDENLKKRIIKLATKVML